MGGNHVLCIVKSLHRYIDSQITILDSHAFTLRFIAEPF